MARDIDIRHILRWNKGLYRYRRGAFAIAPQLDDDVVDALMQPVMKMAGVEKIGNPLHRIVIDKKRAKQSLLRLDVVGRGAVILVRSTLQANDVGLDHAITLNEVPGLTRHCTPRGQY